MFWVLGRLLINCFYMCVQRPDATSFPKLMLIHGTPKWRLSSLALLSYHFSCHFAYYQSWLYILLIWVCLSYLFSKSITLAKGLFFLFCFSFLNQIETMQVTHKKKKKILGEDQNIYNECQIEESNVKYQAAMINMTFFFKQKIDYQMDLLWEHSKKDDL